MLIYKKCIYLIIIGIVYELGCLIFSILYNANILYKINLLNVIIIYKSLYNINYYVEKLYFLINNPDIKISLDDITKFLIVNSIFILLLTIIFIFLDQNNYLNLFPKFLNASTAYYEPYLTN